MGVQQTFTQQASQRTTRLGKLKVHLPNKKCIIFALTIFYLSNKIIKGLYDSINPILVPKICCTLAHLLHAKITSSQKYTFRANKCIPYHTKERQGRVMQQSNCRHEHFITKNMHSHNQECSKLTKYTEWVLGTCYHL